MTTNHEAPAQEAGAGEQVAVVGADFTLFWAGSGPIAPLVRRHGIKVGSQLYAAPQPAIPEGNWLAACGNDPRVNVDSYAHAIEAARSRIGAERPDDDEPEEQWFWDKLTTLLNTARTTQEPDHG